MFSLSDAQGFADGPATAQPIIVRINTDAAERALRYRSVFAEELAKR